MALCYSEPVTCSGELVFLFSLLYIHVPIIVGHSNTSLLNYARGQLMSAFQTTSQLKWISNRDLMVDGSKTSHNPLTIKAREAKHPHIQSGADGSKTSQQAIQVNHLLVCCALHWDLILSSDQIEVFSLSLYYYQHYTGLCFFPVPYKSLFHILV